MFLIESSGGPSASGVAAISSKRDWHQKHHPRNTDRTTNQPQSAQQPPNNWRDDDDAQRATANAMREERAHAEKIYGIIIITAYCSAS